MYSFFNSNNLISVGKALISAPSMIYSTGLPAIFNTSLFDATVNAAIVTTSICYSSRVNKNHQFSAQHVKVALGMISSLQNSYSSVKLISNIGGVANDAWNGKLNIQENLDFWNILKFAGFALNGVSAVSSLKNSALGISTVLGENYLLDIIDSKLPSWFNSWAKDQVNNFISSNANSSIKIFNTMFKDLSPYFDPTTVTEKIEVLSDIVDRDFINLAVTETSTYANSLQEFTQTITSYLGDAINQSGNDWNMIELSDIIPNISSDWQDILNESSKFLGKIVPTDISSDWVL